VAGVTGVTLGKTTLTRPQSNPIAFSMAARTLESRFERMSVNDENAPTDGAKYQKTKVSSAHCTEISFTDHLEDCLDIDLYYPIVTKCKPCQSSQNRHAKSKLNKYSGYCTLPSRTMAKLKHANCNCIATTKTNRVSSGVGGAGQSRTNFVSYLRTTISAKTFSSRHV
jgi:hypothetical protein